jgi:hypothetical protein
MIFHHEDTKARRNGAFIVVILSNRRRRESKEVPNLPFNSALRQFRNSAILFLRASVPPL